MRSFAILSTCVRDHTVIATSVVNALGLDIMKTNINKTSAWERAQEVRLKKAYWHSCEACDGGNQGSRNVSLPQTERRVVPTRVKL